MVCNINRSVVMFNISGAVQTEGLLDYAPVVSLQKGIFFCKNELHNKWALM
jgi:hypothetical protein